MIKLKTFNNWFGLFLLLTFITLFGLLAIKSSNKINAQANSSGQSLTTTSPPTCVAHSFFGLEPWYQYLKTYPITNNNLFANQAPGCGICFNVLRNQYEPQCSSDTNNSDIPLVLLAILDDVFRIAGFASVVMIFYGAFVFVTSQGESEKVVKGRRILSATVIGSIISLSAVGLVSYIGDSLSCSSGSNCSASSSSAPITSSVSANTNTVEQFLQIALAILGAVALLYIVIGGFKYIISSGDPQKAANGRKNIIYASVGLIIAIAGEAVLTWILGQI